MTVKSNVKIYINSLLKTVYSLKVTRVKNMNFRFIFGILLTIEVVLSNENRYECARKRKSGWFKIR